MLLCMLCPHRVEVGLVQGVAAGEGEVCEDQPQHVGSLRVSASMNTLERAEVYIPASL